MEFDCSHAFCTPCMLRQLAARWSGSRISFNYLQCSLCRKELAHQELQVPLRIHLGFKRRIEQLARISFQEDPSFAAWHSKLAYSPDDQEMCKEAMNTMAMFMCSKCDEPFCGGRISCAQQQDVDADDLCCSRCDWMVRINQEDSRRKLHGHSFALFKCDFCCDIAVYRCFGTTNFCERCHQQSDSGKYYPCPGEDVCSLLIPHPRITSSAGEGAVHSFVLGCSACKGSQEAHLGLVTKGSEGEFGYPKRTWKHFTGGDMLLAGVAEREVRHRLRLHQHSAPQGGSAAECAERLLLLELGWKSLEVLLEAQGGGRAVLQRRLDAVGLRQDGSSLELAKRLFLLRDVSLSALGPEHVVTQDDNQLPPFESVSDDEDIQIDQGTPRGWTFHCSVFVAFLTLLLMIVSLDVRTQW